MFPFTLLEHDILQDLKACALALRDEGKQLTRDNYQYWRLAKYTIKRVTETFGTFSQAVTAAGLEPARKKNKDKKSVSAEYNEKFTVSVESAIVPANPSTRPMAGRERGTAVIAGDIHFPFSDANALSAFYCLLEDLKSDVEVVAQAGDLYDFYSFSKFPTSKNIYKPDDEIRVARAMAEEFWRTVNKIVPSARKIQILGNHSVRPYKRLMEAWPEGETLMDLSRWWEFPGVKTYHDIREEVPIADALLMHGYRSKLGEHRDHLLRNVVCGHIHVGGVSYRSIRLPGTDKNTVLYELNCGFLASAESKALSYTPQKITRWTHGAGVIDKWGPRFVAF